MKPPPLQYFRPASIGEALSILADSDGNARVLAGGQSLVPQLNQRQIPSCSAIIDVNRIPSLSGISVVNNQLRIGSMTRQCELERDPFVLESFPEFQSLLPYIGFSATRNRGTVGGSLAFADPAAELPALALSFGATVEIQSQATGTRLLSVDDLLLSPFKTILRPEELVTAVNIPIRSSIPPFYVREVNLRATGRAIAGIIAHRDGEDAAEVTLFAWADRPRRRKISIPQMQELTSPSDWVAPFERLSSMPVWQTDPHGTADYRKHVFGSLLQSAASNLGLI